MSKESLLNNIIKEMKIVRRLSTKIPADQINFRPKEGMRSSLELLQYLCSCGTGTIRYWYRNDTSDFRTFIGGLREHTQTVTHHTFVSEMDAQIVLVKELFDKITEDDLLNKEVDYPWGEKAMLGEAIVATCIKWLTAYKMQLFINIKMSSDEKMGTPDLWRTTEIEGLAN
jgi:hypothetical protein